jgi:uncharacterized protein
MKRLVEARLSRWVVDPRRKPLLLRGARQVGKTYSIRALGEAFDSYVEVNFERSPGAASVFDVDLDPRRIVRDIGLIVGQPIEPGRTLLFLDELQEAPRGLTALRYFHEELPELHVIGAGSLLEFQIEAHGLPVGRVDFAHMFPMTFVEFLWAKGQPQLAEFIHHKLPDSPVTEAVHVKALALLGEYLAIGGMPEVVQCWTDAADLDACNALHQQIIQSYRQDFEKYATKSQVARVAHLFDELPFHVARKWKFANVSGDHRARELRPALDLLEKCHIIQSVYHSSAQGLPLSAQSDRKKRKIIMLDVGLMQTMLGLDARPWILAPDAEFVNRGTVVESFVGQELACHLSDVGRASLHYWHRESRSSNAEVDYLLPTGEHVIPIEVKSGAKGRFASLRSFLESHPNSPYGVLLSPANAASTEELRRYPLYSISALVQEARSK